MPRSSTAKMVGTLVIYLATFMGIQLLSGAAMADEAELSRTRAEILKKGQHWTAGETSMTALTPEQRRARLIQTTPTIDPQAPPSVYDGAVPMDVSPDAPVVDPAAERFSWADVDGEDWTTPVKDQGDCGSCAVFAATAVTEARANISYGDPDLDLDLAEQSLLSCTSGSSCTLGTWETTLFIPTLRDDGIPDEFCHPYTATDGNCADACGGVESRKFRIVDGGWLPSSGTLTSATDEDIKAALASGPVYANMMVPDSFFSYTGGVYEGSVVPLSWHTVAIVGWDNHTSDAAPPSWIVKNSWGTGWGMNGFFEIKRGDATLIGSQATALEVEALSALGAVMCPVNAPEYVEMEDGSGEVFTQSLALEICDGEGGMPFKVEMTSTLAPWLEISQEDGQIPFDGGVGVDLTYSEENFDGVGSEWQHLYVIGQNGQSRHVPVGMKVSSPADVDTDTDTDTDTDSDTDADTDSDTDSDSDPDGGIGGGEEVEEGCGCRTAGAVGSRSWIVELLSALALFS